MTASKLALPLRQISSLVRSRRLLPRRSHSTISAPSDSLLEDARGDAAYSLSFGVENSFGTEHMGALLTATMRSQLEHSANRAAAAMMTTTRGARGPTADQPAARAREEEKEVTAVVGFPNPDSRPLPLTLREALLDSTTMAATATGEAEAEPRAIVVTEKAAPFRIVHVNGVWEGLCGHSADHAVGRTIGSLLSGPETDAGATAALVYEMLRGETEEAGTVLTNYRGGSDGRPFRNRLRVGPLWEEVDGVEGGGGERKLTHFVGVLREVQDGY